MTSLFAEVDPSAVSVEDDTGRGAGARTLRAYHAVAGIAAHRAGASYRCDIGASRARKVALGTAAGGKEGAVPRARVLHGLSPDLTDDEVDAVVLLLATESLNVGRPRARLAGGLLGTALLCGLSWYVGGQHERGRLDAMVAEERRVAETERARQADALRDVQAASDLRAEQATAAATDLQGRIDAYVAELSHRPVDARCTLTDADLRGLRDYGPGGSPARSRRRPARAAADAE